MGEDLFNDIKGALEKYDKSVDEVDKHYDEVKILGRYDPATPYCGKYGVLSLIDFLEKEGVDVSDLRERFKKINEKLKKLEEKRRDLRDKLYDELKFYVSSYSKIVGLFFEGEPVEDETYMDLLKRDILEVLLMELKSDHDVDCMEKIVSALDQTLELKFYGNIEAILSICPDIEVPFRPPNFWWRHPSKILKEKEQASSTLKERSS